MERLTPLVIRDGQGIEWKQLQLTSQRHNGPRSRAEFMRICDTQRISSSDVVASRGSLFPVRL